MPFYRVVNDEDFRREYEYLTWSLTADIRKLLDEGHNLKAVKLIRESRGGGLKEAKEWADRYIKYNKAYEGFKNGEKIYTEY